MKPSIALGKTPPPVVAPPPPRRWWRFAFLALPALAILAATALFTLDRRPDALCRQWEREARTAEGEQLTEIITRLDAYGRYGLPSLVRLLQADQEAAAEAAREVLTSRLRLATAYGPASDRAAAALIAAELHQMADGRKQNVSQATADVALELLAVIGRLKLADMPDDDTHENMLLACDEVLRLAPVPRASSEPLVTLDVPQISASFELPDVPAVVESGSAADGATGNEPRMPVDVVSSTLAEAAPVPVLIPPQPVVAAQVESPTIAANTAARINPVRDPADEASILPATATTSLSASPPSVPVERPQVDAWSLFAALHGPQPEIAEAALRRRNFTPREIELGRHLCSPHLEERRHYARSLPMLGGIDVRPWLLHLSHDVDSEVRLSAAAIMATSNDPALLDRVRTMSLDDSDIRVRTTAQRAGDAKALRR